MGDGRARMKVQSKSGHPGNLTVKKSTKGGTFKNVLMTFTDVIMCDSVRREFKRTISCV